jgi:uncharacterized protein (DUF1330 family)
MKIIGLIKLLDQKAFSRYRDLVGSTVSAYDGVVRFRGTKIFTVWNELSCGDFDAMVEIEFRSSEQARRWADSPEYRALLGIRSEAMLLTLFGVE